MFWREHDHFTSRVLARFLSEPFDWFLLPSGDWIVATSEALWQATKTGNVTLVARLPAALEYSSSIASADDGTLYVTGRNSVLRLRPVWNEQPKYASDILIPTGTEYQKCWANWLSHGTETSEMSQSRSNSAFQAAAAVERGRSPLQAPAGARR